MFICADASSYHIYNVDIYQGRNASNIDIDDTIATVPTTQKAVLNAMIQMGLEEDITQGARSLALDNRYQCPELAHCLRERFYIYSYGTCRSNRKGWNKDIFDLVKKQPRGTFKRAYDRNNKVVCIQWVDSQVVNFVTSDTNNWEVGEVKRQVGSEKKSVTCPLSIQKYQRTMFGVDKGDQFRARGGGLLIKRISRNGTRKSTWVYWTSCF
jgi:hypothetical protein